MRAFGVVLLVLPTACVETPPLVFASDEASAPAPDAAAPASDAAREAAFDAATDGVVDIDGDVMDAADQCVNGVPPPGGNLCCGNVPCVDRSGNGCDCAVCASLACSGWCCVNSNQKASCKNKATACK